MALPKFSFTPGVIAAILALALGLALVLQGVLVEVAVVVALSTSISHAGAAPLQGAREKQKGRGCGRCKGCAAPRYKNRGPVLSSPKRDRSPLGTCT